MDFPGHIIKIGEPDAAINIALATALAAKGFASTSPPGVFDARFKALISLFQSQHADTLGRPLRVDGEVGLMTWGALFGAVAVNTPPSGIAGAALGIAMSQIGVMEVPLGSNRGPEVDAYQIASGLSLGRPPAAGFFWCMSFVFWCFREAGGGTTPFPRTAGCLAAWNKVRANAPNRIVTRAQALANPAIVRPGMVFILDHGGGMGHTGFVRQSVGGALKTVEGNTNPTGSSNGLGVFELNRRNVMDRTLKGFIDFT